MRTIDLKYGDVILESNSSNKTRRFFVLKNRGQNALIIGLDDETFSSRFDLRDADLYGVKYTVRAATLEEFKEATEEFIDDYFERY